LSYTATKEYFSKRDANRAHKKYGDSVFLFSPREGVTCNRRTETCSRPQWTKRVFGDEASRLRQLDRRNMRPDRDVRPDRDDRAADNRLPRRLRERLDDDDAGPNLWPPAQARDDERAARRRLLMLSGPGADDDDRLRRLPTSRIQRDDRDDSERPRLRPRNGDTDRPLLPRRMRPETRERSGGGGCTRNLCD
jgi:hypothetical protein